MVFYQSPIADMSAFASSSLTEEEEEADMC